MTGAMTAACASGRAAPPGVVPEGAAVRIVLSPPRDIVVAASGDSAVVRGVGELLGRVRAARGDTLVIAISSTRTADGGSSDPTLRRPTVTIVRTPDVGVTVLSRHPGLVDAVGAAAIPAVLLGLALFLWWGFSHAST